MRDWLLKQLRKLHPDYDCECCIGQEKHQGCYCAYHKAYLPCEPNGPWWWNYVLRLEVYLRRDT